MKKIFNKLKNYIYNITHPCLKNSLRWGNLTMGCMFILTKIFYDKGLFLFIFLLQITIQNYTKPSKFSRIFSIICFIKKSLTTKDGILFCYFPVYWT